MRSPVYELLGNIKQRRQAIPAEAVLIGEYKRRPQRIGRRVTQEELAEALGITREWYCNLENGKCSEASPELVRKIAVALHDRRAARRMQWGNEDPIVPSLADFREFINRIASAATYFDAAVEAMETTSRMLQNTCVSVINLDGTGDGGEALRHAIGPRARFWKPACDSVFRDAHRALRYGGVGISENIPLADEIADDTPLILTFERISDYGSSNYDSKYEYECTPELWREFNGDLEIRSAIIIALRDRSRYRGAAAFAWSEPRKIELREIELVRTFVAVLALIPSSGTTS
jgi:transcriptional regulator with XRE-family HTH domain